MKHTQNLFLALILIISIIQVATAKPSGAPTLQNFIGGRSGGMGEAFSTIEDDVTVWEYNPATLATLKTPQIASTFSRGLAADYFSAISYGFPTRAGTIAGSFGYYDTGSEKLFSPDGAEFDVHLQQDLLCSLSYANQVGPVNLGVSGKFLRSELVETVSATTLAMDLGAMVRIPSQNLSLGVAIRNIGPGIKFIEEVDPLPLEVRFGGSYLLPFESQQSKVVLSADIPYLVNEKTTLIKLGAEYTYRNSLSFQVGYPVNSDSQNLTFGAGMLWDSVVFNYGFGLANGLSNTHRITLGYRFAQASAETKSPKPKPIVQAETEIPKLIKALQNNSWETRRDAALRLGELGDTQAVEPLISALIDENYEVSGTAARALGKIGDPRALPPLIDALTDMSPYVRASAAWGLGRLGDRRAIAPLKRLLADEKATVVKMASEAIEKIKKPK